MPKDNQSLNLIARPLPPAPNVPTQEMKARLYNIQQKMAANKVDYIVLTDKKNISYFTDYHSMSWAYHARPLFVVISQSELNLIAGQTETRNLNTRPRCFSTVYYNGYLDDAIRTICAFISNSTNHKPYIGLDYGADMFGRGSLFMIDQLRNLCAPNGLSSANEMLWQVRLIKTQFEADQKRIALNIVHSAFDSAIANAYIGMPEYELCQQMQAQIFLNGAESADPIAMLFSKGNFAYCRPPSERLLEIDDYIWTDFRATYGGYPADKNHIARAGHPKEWEIETYTKTRNLTITLCESVCAGQTFGQLYSTFEQLWQDADLGKLYGKVSRIGHGGGLDVTEPPSVSKDNKELIQAGMILHLEPKLERDGAVFQFEEVIYVHDDKIEFLSKLSPETVPVIL